MFLLRSQIDHSAVDEEQSIFRHSMIRRSFFSGTASSHPNFECDGSCDSWPKQRPLGSDLRPATTVTACQTSKREIRKNGDSLLEC